MEENHFLSFRSTEIFNAVVSKFEVFSGFLLISF